MAKSLSKRLIVILLVAFAARGTFGLLKQVTYPDSITDLEIARNILDGKGFVFRGRILLRAPGYPVLLATSLSLGGLWFAVAIQVLASTATCYIVYASARRKFGETQAEYAAALAAIYPSFAFMAGTFLSETVFIFFFMWSMLMLLDVRARLRWRHAAAAGALNGAACLLRPSHFLFIFFLLPFFVAHGGKRLKALGLWALSAAASFLVLTPWIVRNYVHTGKLVATTLQVGASLYEANSPDATGGPAMDKTKWPQELQSMSEYESNRYLLAKALNYMRSHPGRTLKLTLVKFRRLWNPVPNDPEQRTIAVSALMLVSYVPVMLLGLVGLVWSVRQKRATGLLVVPILYYMLLHSVFVGSVRYRIPIMPYVITFAGNGANAVWLGIRRRLKASS